MCDEAGERQRLAGKHTYTMGQDKRDTSEWALLPRLRSLDGWKIPQHFYDRLDRAKHELGIPPGVSTEEFALDCMMVGLDLRLRLKIEAEAAASVGTPVSPNPKINAK